jgi:large subunit ribosomal protein L9
MKVILLKNVPKVGKKDEIVEVNQGYATNALFPQKLAMLATPEAISSLKKRQQNTIAQKEIKKNLLDRAIQDLNGENITIAVQANEQGNLFSKIDAKDIASAFAKKDIPLDPKMIIVPGEVIKKVGEYDIQIKDGEYSAVVKVTIKGK